MFYCGSDQHLHHLFWNRSTNVWSDEDLTLLGGAAITPSNFSGFVDSGGEHVYYTDGFWVHAVTWTATSGWKDFNLSQITGSGYIAQQTGPTSTYDGNGGRYVFYTTGNCSSFNLNEMVMNPSSGIWTNTQFSQVFSCGDTRKLTASPGGSGVLPRVFFLPFEVYQTDVLTYPTFLDLNQNVGVLGGVPGAYVLGGTTSWLTSFTY